MKKEMSAKDRSGPLLPGKTKEIKGALEIINNNEECS